MELQTQGNTGIYVTLVPEELIFSGSKEMSMYFVKDFQMDVETLGKLSTVTGIYGIQPFMKLFNLSFPSDHHAW